MKEVTLNLYSRVLNKIQVESIDDLVDHNAVIAKIESLSSNSYKIMAYSAIKYLYGDNLKKNEYEKEYKKLQNNIYNDNRGKLPMTLEELKNIKVICKEPLRQLVEEFTVYINTHYPLRLDYYNVGIVENLQSILLNPTEKENCVNYMTYYNGILTFYLNDFKNIRSFGNQVIEYNDPIICNYIEALQRHFGKMPDFLLYRYDIPTGTLLPFSSRNMYGGYLQELFKRHTGLNISMNTIRKIHESALIQSPEYSKMTFSEKKTKHSALLHSLQTAHASYNIVIKD